MADDFTDNRLKGPQRIVVYTIGPSMLRCMHRHLVERVATGAGLIIVPVCVTQLRDCLLYLFVIRVICFPIREKNSWHFLLRSSFAVKHYVVLPCSVPVEKDN